MIIDELAAMLDSSGVHQLQRQLSAIPSEQVRQFHENSVSRQIERAVLQPSWIEEQRRRISQFFPSDPIREEILRLQREREEARRMSGLPDSYSIIASSDPYAHVFDLPIFVPTPTCVPLQGRSDSELAADAFLEGVRQTIQQLEADLESDEELVVCCTNGFEVIRVDNVSVSPNGIATVSGVDGENNQTKIVAHFKVLQFTYKVVRTPEDRERLKIGFTA